MWITNSGEAEYFLVFANVDPSKGYKGITCFMVEKEWGVQIAKKEKKASSRRGRGGQRCSWADFDHFVLFGRPPCWLLRGVAGNPRFFHLSALL